MRNKLDGNIYAIKRILIDAKSRQLNRKMTREVPPTLFQSCRTQFTHLYT